MIIGSCKSNYPIYLACTEYCNKTISSLFSPLSSCPHIKVPLLTSCTCCQDYFPKLGIPSLFFKNMAGFLFELFFFRRKCHLCRHILYRHKVFLKVLMNAFFCRTKMEGGCLLNQDTLIFLITKIISSVQPLSRHESGRFGALKSDSNHHLFRNACTKSGSLRFSQFAGC